MGRVRRTAVIVWIVMVMGLAQMSGCAKGSGLSEEAGGGKPGCVGSLSLQYAKNFSVEYYEGGYTLLSLKDGTQFLVMDAESEMPPGFGENVVVLRRPVENLYLVASAAMDMFCELDALDAVSLSGQKADGWYIEKARQAMEQGRLLYAGKYNKPDYELILSTGCQLAIENRMITHSPEVVEKLEDFGIPVMIDYSSYETHPMGRMEWIKFYGALLGKEELAKELFDAQEEILTEVGAEERTDQTVAFFYITSNGYVQIRASDDYVPKMIELAGGNYIFSDLKEGMGRSTVNIQLEEFYRTAKDADYLIYNSTIDGGVATVEELVEKSGMLAEFKAVQNGNVWCTANDMYQQSMSVGYMIEDIHRMLSQEEPEDMRYLFRLE